MKKDIKHEAEDAPGLAVRRRTDRCFFEADEVVRGPGGDVEGYVVEGVMWGVDDVAEVRPMTAAACVGRSPLGDPAPRTPTPEPGAP